MADEVSLGEPCFSYPDDSETFSPARIRRFSQFVLSPEAWFCTADELIAAMDLLEPHVEQFWEDVRSIAFAADATSDEPSKPQKSDAPSNQQNSGEPSKHSLINQHMMLAGFAIENLCKGYLASRLTSEGQERVKRGDLPESLGNHRILKLIEKIGMTLSDTEENLIKRITDAVVWRGRYPSPKSHEGRRPFLQAGYDVDHIKTFLHKLRRHVGAKDS